jgi:hypothetical protein
MMTSRLGPHTEHSMLDKETKGYYGKMKGQNTTAFNLFLSLYVDDGSFLFKTKEDMERGASILKSNEEIRTANAHWQEQRQVQNRGVVHPPPGTEASEADRNKIFVENTDQGYVTFNRRFTYLGSIITNDLEDSAEIHARIGKANGILHGLNSLRRSKGLSVSMKKQFYIVTVVN